MVPKKDAGYRLINAAIEINKYTVRDANIPPNVEEFSEEFTGQAISTLIDLFSGYN